MKARIIERKYPCGKIVYVIQQKHFLFKWWWVDAWVNHLSTTVQDTFYTLDEAKNNLCEFDGTPIKERVIEVIKNQHNERE